MTYAEIEAELFARTRHGMRLGLDRMRRALAELGHPERSAPAIHVAGTNGKGSVCAMIDAACRAAGLKTGLYTSPHLERFGERFRVSGVEATEERIVRAYEELKARVPWAFEGTDELTFFEITTLLAFQIFAAERVDVMVVEVGLGGRMDATNVLQPLVTCVTQVGLDHTQYLGKSISDIALEKAGIFQSGVPAVIAAQDSDEARRVLVDRAQRVGAAPSVEGADFGLEGRTQPWRFRSRLGTVDGVRLALAGSFQRSNASVAIQALLLAARRGLRVSPGAILRGLREVAWPGRMETVRTRPEVLLDGAHNPPAARALADTMRQIYAGHRIHVVFGMLDDKDAAPVVESIASFASRIVVTQPTNERALPAEELARLVARHTARHVVRPEAGRAIDETLAEAAPGDVVLVCGSLYLVGEARARLLRGARPTGPSERLTAR